MNAIPGMEIIPTKLGNVVIKQKTPEAGQIVVTATYVEAFVQLVNEAAKQAVKLRQSQPKQPHSKTMGGRRVAM